MRIDNKKRELELIKRLREQLQVQEQELKAHKELLAKADETIAAANIKLQEQHEEIERLRQQLNYYLNQKYGKKSEKVVDEQGEGTFDEIDKEPQQKAKTTKKHKTDKRPLPDDLPRERVIIDLPEEEKVCSCGKGLHKIGEEVSEKLDIIPAQVRILELIRPKYCCRDCEMGVKIANLPVTILPKSLVTPGAVSHILLSKYVDHLPLYRQEQIFQRMGFDIARNTLCNWVLDCSDRLLPLHELMKRDLLRGPYIQADETPVQVLNHAKDTKHYMWVYLNKKQNQNILIYDYNQSRSGTVVQEFLNNYKGLLHTDGYSGYNQISSVTHGACWAHVRRKYIEIIKNCAKPGIARQAVELIGQLYSIERQAQEQYLTYEMRGSLRKEKAPAILKELKILLDNKIKQVPPRSPIGRAISYNLKLWDKLLVYIDYGQMEIDTNLVENAIRPFALGRRNWLFNGNERGAKAASIVYSLLLTCKHNNIEPYAYMKYILYKLPKIQPDKYHTLLPYNIDTKLLTTIYTEWLY